VSGQFDIAQPGLEGPLIVHLFGEAYVFVETVPFQEADLPLRKASFRQWIAVLITPLMPMSSSVLRTPMLL
jgi:hypothetical protein